MAHWTEIQEFIICDSIVIALGINSISASLMDFSPYIMRDVEDSQIVHSVS